MATTYRTDAGRGAARVSSEILDRLPPHNLDAEKGVLGSLLLDPQMADNVALVVHADDFYAEANQKLFAHLLAMHDEGGRIDTTLLLERLSAAGDLELIGGAAYLAEVVHAVPHAANAVYYAEIVRDKATLRALIHASTEILRDAYEPTLEPREMVGRAEELIFAVHDQRSTDQITNAHDLMAEGESALHSATTSVSARLAYSSIIVSARSRAAIIVGLSSICWHSWAKWVTSGSRAIMLAGSPDASASSASGNRSSS